MPPPKTRRLPPDITKIILRTVMAAAHDPDPTMAARSIARSTTIAGLMLEDMSERNFKGGKRFAAWITRIGQVLWGLVELAAPRSLGEVLFQYWIWLLYALAAAMLLIGGLTGGTGVIRAGATTALFAFGAHLAVGALRNWLRRSRHLFGGWVPAIVLAMSLAGVVYSGNRIMAVTPPNAQPGAGWGVEGLMGRLGSPQAVTDLLGNPHDQDADKARKAQANIANARESLALDFLFILCYVFAFVSAGAWLVEACGKLARPQMALALVAALAVSTAITDLLENARASAALSGLDWNLPYFTGAKLGLAAATLAALGALGVFAIARRR